MALLDSNTSPAQTYSVVNTILAVVGTLLVVAVTLFLSVKVSVRRSKRRPESGEDQDLAVAAENDDEGPAPSIEELRRQLLRLGATSHWGYRH